MLQSKNSTNTDYDFLRERMVREQLVSRGVKDQAVLDAMRTVPRQLFVPEDLRAQAYNDGPLPIGHDQTISQPFIVASMTEHLELTHRSRVLEIGTGCGYQAAVLAEIAKDVFTVELVPELQQSAIQLFRQLHYRNVISKQGDGSLGWPEHAPYDGIIVTAAAPRIPEALIDQLAMNGVMVLPIEDAEYGGQELIKVRKTTGGLVKRSLYQVRFVPMLGAIQQSSGSI
ncbi:MAG TPA: protein-L-isoaspartate(D-aspartate) O-methyltransferase [candidate division Zixibacteria bacterium]|nr:protein-L-isoaspartate(D-aspartate) O-methyltransferase [candidate division Zixibacteria bacterium]